MLQPGGSRHFRFDLIDFVRLQREQSDIRQRPFRTRTDGGEFCLPLPGVRERTQAETTVDDGIHQVFPVE